MKTICDHPLYGKVEESACQCGYVIELHYPPRFDEEQGRDRLMVEFYDIKTKERVFKCPKCKAKWDEGAFQRFADDLDPLNPERAYLRVLQADFLREIRQLALKHDLFSDADPVCRAIEDWITRREHDRPPHEWCIRALERRNFLSEITSFATSALPGATSSKPVLDASIEEDRLKIEALRAWIADRAQRRSAALAACVIRYCSSA
jgi:hypothetical protein